ncbi:hypothetical protein [Azospirillum sp. TSO5]|uniref:hypothetical protein n=1 Tax=Azospirillum sp. TSO5 TaxID=716760 RepID=UPI000D617AFF|nr:hypothetical protein [Azospirillum sp. TSO5]PWC95454.1 hypothetical protein TSO5_10535 [Azospirillum sp. TSO5]
MTTTVQETLALLKSIQAQGGDEALAKSITTAQGLVAYDLQAPAKNLYPQYTPLRNEIPRVGGGIGLATNWRVVQAINGSGFDAMGWVPEGQRSGRMSYQTANRSASFVTIGEEDQISYEAIHAGQGFEDLQASMRMRLLQKMMQKEEHAIIGGNASLVLAQPTAPTLSAGGSGATLPGAPTTYSVIVVALTYEGFRGSSLASGVVTSKTITGADGANYTLNGGSSAPSNAATQAITLGQVLSCSTPAVTGAVGYAWFVGTSGSETLQAITTINSVKFSAPLAGGRQPASAVSGDHSRNSDYAFDGLLTTALGAGSNAYVNYLPTGTAGTGSTLTSSGRGSIVEIDVMLKAMYDNYQVSPSTLYVNSQELNNITNKVLTNSSAPLLRYDQPVNSSDPIALMAGGTVSMYFNPFSNNGGYKIPIKIHPYCPPGMIWGWSKDLPIQYQSNNVPNVAEIKTRKDYYAIDWPIKTRQQESGVYAEEVLAVYAPFAMGVIGNIANG